MGYRNRMKKVRPGPAKQQLQQRALRVLKQKKMYEKQRDGLMQQQFNLDQTKFAQNNLRDTGEMIKAMKTANVALKTQFEETSLDEIDDVMDDMAEMMDMHEEIQDAMSRSYGIGDEIDESELEAELEALEDVDWEEETAQEEVPSYLVSAASAANQAERDAAEAPAEELDEYGLPKVPAQRVNA
jgi:charged multivesicular body protein 5